MGKEFHGQLQLVSKGLFYEDQLPSGIVNCEPWGKVEEQRFLSPSVPFEDTLDFVIKTLTDCKVPPDDLLLADRQQLFLFMRCLTYGGEYSFSYKCQNCPEKGRHHMDLEKDLSVTYADDPELLAELGMESLEEPFTFELPIQGKCVAWRMLRGADEKSVERWKLKQKQKKRKSGFDSSDVIYRLARRIVSVDGESLDILESMEFIRSLRGKDSLAISQEIQAMSFGVDTEIDDVRCAECGYPNDLILPMDKTFFRPEGRVAKH